MRLKERLLEQHNVWLLLLGEIYKLLELLGFRANVPGDDPEY